MVTLVLFGTFVLFLILKLPIGISHGLSSLVTILYSGKIQATYLAQGLFTAADSFPLMAVPFFVLAGELMARGGISQRLLNCADVFLGRKAGGLALVTVVACMFFAAISGSGPATVAAIGGLTIPAMIEQGYDKRFASAIAASAGAIGVIIPPSIPMVMYGVSAGASVAGLFMGGIFPGILIGVGLCLYSSWYCKRRGYISKTAEKGQEWRENSKRKWQKERKEDWKTTGLAEWKQMWDSGGKAEYKAGKKAFRRIAGRTFWDAKWALLVPFIILGGIYGGIFTPTEAAAVAVVYGLCIGVFVYRDLKWKDLFEIFVGASLTTATVMIILGTATTFGRILTLERVPTSVAAFFQSVSSSPIVIMLLINALLLFVGTFMETIAAIIILTPVLLPVAQAAGYDTIHFGLIMVVNLAIGFVTPPLGVNLFVACNVAHCSLEDISKGVLPQIGLLVVILMIITYWAPLSLWLPGVLLK